MAPSVRFCRCGCAEGLEAGRHCLKKWGFRRCEDICWIKTNKEHPGKKLSAVHQEPNSVLVHTKASVMELYSDSETNFRPQMSPAGSLCLSVGATFL